MKSMFYFLILISVSLFYSCNENSGGDKKTNDSAYSGLEGTREDASQLSNATIDTSSGQSVKKTAKDSSFVKKDSLLVK